MKKSKHKEKHYVFPTEYELSKQDKSYRLTANHKKKLDKELGLIDSQNGLIGHWSSRRLKLNKPLIKSISKIIEKWMDEDDTDGRIEIELQSTDKKSYGVGFNKYIVNFQYCANGCEQWMIVKCMLPGFPKIFSKHLGTFLLNTTDDLHFVHNQVFSMTPNYMPYYKRESSLTTGEKK